jgi:hypothetical protein
MTPREPSFFPDDCQITDAAFRAAWLATFDAQESPRMPQDDAAMAATSDRTGRLRNRSGDHLRLLAIGGTRIAPRIGRRRLGWSATSTHRGVYPTPEGRWAAKIRVAGRLYYCGTHDTEAEAAAAVRGREAELLGGKAGA